MLDKTAAMYSAKLIRMKNIKLFISTAVIVLFMTFFSSQVNAQKIHDYKSTIDDNRIKIEFLDNYKSNVWYKATETETWISGEVTYSDEKTIKFKKLLNNKEIVITLISDIYTDHLETTSPNGKTITFTQRSIRSICH